MRLKILAATLGVGLALQALSGTTVAADPPGRGASSDVMFALKVRFTDLLVSAMPMEQISLNLAMSDDLDQPGVTPGGGDVTP